MLCIGGQQGGGHGPGGRDWGREIGRLLAQEPVGVLVEPGEVVVDAMTGLGQVSRGVLRCYGQVAECGGEPPGLSTSPRVFVPAERLVRSEGGHPVAQEAYSLLI